MWLALAYEEVTMVFTSPHADVAIPAVPFHEFVLYRATDAKEQPVFITAENGRSFSYKDLLRDTYRCAGALAAHGLRKGDVFALLLPNSAEFAVAFYGGLAAGGVITPVNPLYTSDEIARQLLDSGARYVLTVPPLLEKVASAAHQGVREIFVLGEADGFTSFRSLLESNCRPPSVSICPREDLAVLPYSSGTSGNPKGVMLTHANLTAGVLAYITAVPHRPGTMELGLLPFFHAAGLVCILHTAIGAGHTLVLLSRFEPESLLRTIQNYRIQSGLLVPPILAAVAKDSRVEDFDLSSLQFLGSGAAPLGADLQA
jgi:acyl-CoA synthetase (AMP-forming)/AMP-acid ligase II